MQKILSSQSMSHRPATCQFFSSLCSSVGAKYGFGRAAHVYKKGQGCHKSAICPEVIWQLGPGSGSSLMRRSMREVKGQWERQAWDYGLHPCLAAISMSLLLPLALSLWQRLPPHRHYYYPSLASVCGAEWAKA